MKKLSLACLLVLFSAPAVAYVGPGVGMGVIGTIFGVFAAIVLAAFGLVWYPLKRALKKRKAGAAGDKRDASIAANQQAEPSDNLLSRPEIPANTGPNNHATNQSGLHDEASGSATGNQTDNKM